jgi:tRNA-Thr(GGU) m(6)t(6)A37 methyltransferase TsaA
MEIEKKKLYDLNRRAFPDEICFKPIGIILTPFKTLKGIPIQSSISKVKGRIEIFEDYENALKDLEKFSHIYCIYYFDLIKLPVPLQSKPFLDNTKKGVFAIRTPFRPNPIGLSIFEILQIKKNVIDILGVDVLDKTPVLDIKPYVSEFDYRSQTKNGWLNGKVKYKES